MYGGFVLFINDGSLYSETATSVNNSDLNDVVSEIVSTIELV